jgi:hypothetical protein
MIKVNVKRKQDKEMKELRVKGRRARRKKIHEKRKQQSTISLQFQLCKCPLARYCSVTSGLKTGLEQRKRRFKISYAVPVR